MAKYYVDWEQVDKEAAPALIEAGARYLEMESYPSVDTLCAIFGIKKEDNNDDIV